MVYILAVSFWEKTSWFCLLLNSVYICVSGISETTYGYITNSQRDQLPVGLIAQLSEQRSGIGEVMDLNLVQA